MRICNEMEAQRIFKVEPLEREEALTLFRELVGEDTISSHPRIQDLAYIVTERCKGLPSTVVNAGRKLAGMKDVWYWEKVTRKPEDFIKEISGMEDQLFHGLKLSYDSLLDDITKLCFIHWFIFPKEYVSRND